MFVAIAIAILFGVATYLICQMRLMKKLFGFMLLSHAVNLFVLVIAGSPLNKRAPIMKDAIVELCVDPVPQALILTAIVIGLAVTSYFIVFLYRFFMYYHTTNLNIIYKDDYE